MIQALILLALSAAAQETASWEAHPGLLQLSGLVVFFGGQGSLSYASPTPASLPPGAVDAGEVRGQACQQGVSIPIGLGINATRVAAGAGKGGYERALADIRAKHPALKGIYDVKVDDHHVAILTIFRRLCTEVTARGFQ
ncbi:MAG: hypothetical protein NTX64_05315 [Elusimicrobia bacterium]|nr:hypothetical protein [Elusimicrobiota bacterium]